MSRSKVQLVVLYMGEAPCLEEQTLQRLNNHPHKRSEGLYAIWETEYRVSVNVSIPQSGRLYFIDTEHNSTELSLLLKGTTPFVIA